MIKYLKKLLVYIVIVSGISWSLAIREESLIAYLIAAIPTFILLIEVTNKAVKHDRPPAQKNYDE